MALNPIYKGMENGPQAINENFQNLFAVGDIHISTSSANPANRFGGTWERFGKGQTLVSVDESDSDFNAANKTGGEKNHTLTVAEIPPHSHQIPMEQKTRSGGSGYTLLDVGSATKVTSENTGGGKAHNNMQPFITVYMWVKVA